jgi:hypothetical protein
MKKISIGIVTAVAVASALVASLNYINLSLPLDSVINSDSRNAGISVSAHYAYYVDTSTLVFDLRDVSSTNSPMDVTRVLLEYAAALDDKNFSEVTLSHTGTEKFRLKGDYFKTLGQEYGQQNPVYTIRTLPEHVYSLNGSAAFGTWTGGILGVLGKQMEDFSEFHKQWYINDLASAAH